MRLGLYVWQSRGTTNENPGCNKLDGLVKMGHRVRPKYNLTVPDQKMLHATMPDYWAYVKPA